MTKGVHPFYDRALAGFRAAAAGAGVEVVEVQPDRFDAKLQIEAMERLIANRVDGIAISPLDSAALAPVMERAAKAGIAVVTFDAPGARAYPFIGLDNEEAGRVFAGHVVKAIGGEGGVLVVLYGGASGIWLRLKGFRERLAEIAPGVRLLDIVDTSASGPAAEGRIGAALAGSPAPAAVVGLSADGALVARKVLAGKLAPASGGSSRVVLAGFDDPPPTLGAIRSGEVAFTLVQRTYWQGRLSLEYLVAATEGRAPPAVTDTGSFLVTAANVDTYLEQIETSR